MSDNQATDQPAETENDTSAAPESAGVAESGHITTRPLTTQAALQQSKKLEEASAVPADEAEAAVSTPPTEPGTTPVTAHPTEPGAAPASEPPAEPATESPVQRPEPPKTTELRKSAMKTEEDMASVDIVAAAMADVPKDPSEPGAPAAAPAEPAASPLDSTQFKHIAGPLNANIPYQVPEVPPHFAPRAELLAIKKLVINRANGSLAPITLHGGGGAGKTALAVALAHDAEVISAFTDGVLMVSLGDDGDIQHAQATWGAALGNTLNNLPDIASRTTALRNLLENRTCLLIIDDVTDIEQVKALNVGGPNCVRIITTDKADEVTYSLKTRRYTIGKMSESEALTLITEWAGILPDIYLTTVKEIIRRLGNWALPLALVGAQARQGITWLRLLEVLRDDQGAISNLDPDNLDVRRNALGLVVNVVLSRFGGAQLQRCTLLGAFAAGTGAPFSLDAAAACWGVAPHDARATLDLLIESALVTRLPNDFYALHKALRDHLRRAATPTALVEAAGRVRDHYLQLVDQASLNPAQISAQLAQIMTVFKQTSEQNPALADQFADALITFFEGRGLWANLVTLAAAVADAAHKSGDLQREFMFLGDLGYAHTVLGSLEKAKDCFERSLMVSEALGDPGGEATALNNIGAIFERKGEFANAQEFYERSLGIRQEMGGAEEIVEALNNVAGALYWQNRWDEALVTYQRVLDLHNVFGDRHGQAQTLLSIGAVHENMGSDHEALQAYSQSLAMYANLNDENGQSQALNNLGIVYLNQGDPERALAHFKRSLALKEKLGDRSGQASTLNNIALLYEKTGSPALALEHYEQAYQLLKSMDDPRADVVQENIAKVKAESKK